MTIDFRRQLFISIGIIVISVIATSVATYILAGDITGEVHAIATSRGLISQQTGVLATLADLKRQAPQAAAYQGDIEQLLPTQDTLIDFGDSLTTMATANQVTVNFSFDGNPTLPSGTAAGQSNFSLQVNGSLTNIAAFLQAAETQSTGFLLKIPSFTLSADNGAYRFTAPGTLFFRP